MGWRRWVLSTFCSAMFLVLFVQVTWAFYVDPKKKTLEVIGKVQSRASMRLQDSDGFTQPIDIHVGDLVQWRNLAMIEINHDLKQLTRELDILYPLKALKIKAKYHLVGRFMYEAVYDVGPQPFQDVRDQDKENIDNFKQAYDLWEAYVDLSRGPVFIRIGRQNLAWGETDVFRLLDGINPLDNTFGGVFEDLDDRRIPLWMLRGSYNFGRVGPVSALTVEGFWVPGNLDVRVAPVSPVGTAYSAPQPETPIPTFVITPGKTMSNSRWGVRVMGLLADNFNVSVGHYQSYLDIPALRLGGRGESARRVDRDQFSGGTGHRGFAELLGAAHGCDRPYRGGLVLGRACLHPGDQYPSRSSPYFDSRHYRACLRTAKSRKRIC